jgi:hypothetical protein
MAVKYTYIITDFANNAVFAGGLGEEIEASPITTALSYILTSPNACDIYFESTLTAGEVTTLDGLVASHEGIEPFVDAGLVLSPDGKGSYDWDSITVISGAVHYLDMLNFIEEIYEDITTVSGSIKDIQEAVTTLSGIVEDIPRNFTDLDDTPATYSGLAGMVPVVNETEDGVDFVTISGAGTDTKVFSFALRESSKDYFEASSIIWLVAATFPFPGTTLAQPSTFSIVASRDGSTDESECRLYDITNAVEICYFSWTVEDKAIYTSTALSSLSADEAMLEVQIKKTSNPASKTRIHSAVLK